MSSSDFTRFSPTLIIESTGIVAFLSQCLDADLWSQKITSAYRVNLSERKNKPFSSKTCTKTLSPKEFKASLPEDWMGSGIDDWPPRFIDRASELCFFTW